jgi:hypothetical protein
MHRGSAAASRGAGATGTLRAIEFSVVDPAVVAVRRPVTIVLDIPAGAMYEEVVLHGQPKGERMRDILKLAALCVVVGGLALGRPARADGDHATMPEKLKEAGFQADLDAAMKKAAANKQVILVYMTPSWFT